MLAVRFLHTKRLQLSNLSFDPVPGFQHIGANLGFYPYVTVSKASMSTSTAVDVGVISKLLRTTHHGEWWHVLWTSVACH